MTLEYFWMVKLNNNSYNLIRNDNYFCNRYRKIFKSNDILYVTITAIECIIYNRDLNKFACETYNKCIF